MRLPKPKFSHPPEIYLAIIKEHRDCAVRLAERLQACGWAMADAAWAAVNWDLPTLAAAVANERAARDAKITLLSEAEVARLRAQLEGAKGPPATPPSKKTTRIIRTPKPPASPTKDTNRPQA